MKLKLGLIIACFVMGCSSFAAITIEPEAVDSIGRIAKPVTFCVKSPEDLRGLIRGEQEKFALIAPPSPFLYWSRIEGRDVFVEWEDWGESKKLAFAYLDKNMIPRYELKIWEDFDTGMIFVVNDRNEIMAKLAPEKGFDPYGFWLKGQTRDASVSELSEFEQVWYSSAHTALSLILTPISFAGVCSDIREEERAQAELEASMVPMAMMSMGGGSVSNLQLAISMTTNSTAELEIRWPVSFSNELEIFATADLAGHMWQVVCAGIITSNSTHYIWEDGASTNAPVCFYIASKADVDTDEDGLADGREIYLYGSQTNSTDSDADGISDYAEVMASFPTDPSDDDVSAPTIWIASPVSNVLVVP